MKFVYEIRKTLSLPVPQEIDDGKQRQKGWLKLEHEINKTKGCFVVLCENIIGKGVVINSESYRENKKEIQI